MNVEFRLDRLARLASADKNKRFDRLYRELTKTDLLMYAYEQIKNNKGSKTPGIDGLNKFSWTAEKAEKLARQLENGTYEPLPVRRVLIDKKNKPGQKRPLGIPTFGDRIVQSAVKLILEALYEPIFLDCSHGFRPERACQTAMWQIIDSPQVRIDWVVEGDIKGCFDNICHQKLLVLLQRRVKDDRFLKLIAKFLKAGYFERERWNPTKAGTPQGGIISPLLANIYLHEIDEFVQNEFGANQTAKQTKKEQQSRFSEEYERNRCKINYLRAMLNGKRPMTRPREQIEAEMREVKETRKRIACMDKPIKPRITYVRYADDFVITLRNLPKVEAERIKTRLTGWVEQELALILSPEKTLITHIKDGFKFLGYGVIERKTEGKHPRVRMVIPYESAQNEVRDIKEVCRNFSTPETDVIRKLNNKLRGWMMYYRCVDAPSRAMVSVLSQTWWAYAEYVSRKNGCNIATAASRWIKRCPASRTNPKGGQKSWYAETTDGNGNFTQEYLIAVPIPKRSLFYVAKDIREGISTLKREASVTC
ncbi:MAG: Group II intron-encoded protein LtrA [Lentisphaerae bacterium ADurb.Bin242]|nr:MAG: Group II intron-encoded protein LtrA [Lentisphaerae bacterium ADurb.Bin242]